MFYSERLKNIREERDIKQKELAKLLNIKENSYSEYETEYKTIPIKHLITLCDYLNVSIDYLFGFTNAYRYSDKKTGIDKTLSGQRLKEFRKENNLTQKRLAEFLNTVDAVICNYENGKHIIATPFLYDICSKYKISSDYLLGKTGNYKYLK